MVITVKQALAAVGLVALMAGGMTAPAFAAQEEAARKITRKVKPIYPALAKPLHLVGNVRLSLVVAPDGKVKAVKVVGGHPLLAAAADAAARQWLYEAGKETNELVTFQFDPNSGD